MKNLINAVIDFFYLKVPIIFSMTATMKIKVAVMEIIYPIMKNKIAIMNFKGSCHEK